MAFFEGLVFGGGILRYVDGAVVILVFVRCNFWKYHPISWCVFSCPRSSIGKIYDLSPPLIISTSKLVVSRNFLSIRIVLNCFYQLIFYFLKILNLKLAFAVCRIREA